MTRSKRGWRAALGVLSAGALVACGGGGTSESDGIRTALGDKGIKEGFSIPRVAGCRGPNDSPEQALQGQVPKAVRESPEGFKGYNCNLELVGQLQGEGGNWSSAMFSDSAGRSCAYYATAAPNAARQHPGVPVIDITDPARPVRTTSLTTPGMIGPWESLRANPRRQILMADQGTGPASPFFDIYDLSGDCRSPQLLASLKVGDGADGGIVLPRAVVGHEGGISPDGLTYYIGELGGSGSYHAIDITNTTKPKLIATFNVRTAFGVAPHGLSVSEDGNRLYGVTFGQGRAGQADTVPANNGFVIYDTSEVQQRKPNAQIKVISSTFFRDGSAGQHTIPIKIDGKQHLVMVDEGGSGSMDASCAAGMAPFPMARIYDITDEKNPVLVKKLALETHDPANCDQIRPDPVSAFFSYGSHYCSVDNRENATALACSYFNSGIRVFDIRKPEKTKEIAYYNPASVPVLPAGSSHGGSWRKGGPDWCTSRLDWDFQKKQLITMCQDNGLLVLKFGPGTWPFAQSTPSHEHN
jgi:hypothetical protein